MTTFCLDFGQNEEEMRRHPRLAGGLNALVEKNTVAIVASCDWKIWCVDRATKTICKKGETRDMA